MAVATRLQLVALTREYMDAVGSRRWSDSLITTELADVFDSEWATILGADRHYRFGAREVTTDANGQIALEDLNSGTGNTLERLHRILRVSDATGYYRELKFEQASAPSLQSTVLYGTVGRGFYLVGDFLQILPPTPDVALTVYVNWMPQGIADLAADGDAVDFPENAHTILCKEAASQLLMKGAAELTAAEAWAKSAEKSRGAMLDQIRRRTTAPTFMGYTDSAHEYAG